MTYLIVMRDMETNPLVTLGISWLESKTTPLSPRRITLSHSLSWYQSSHQTYQPSGYYVFRPQKIAKSKLNATLSDLGVRFVVPLQQVLYLHRSEKSVVPGQPNSKETDDERPVVGDDHKRNGKNAIDTGTDKTTPNRCQEQATERTAFSSPPLCQRVLFLHSAASETPSFPLSTDPNGSPSYLELSLCKNQRTLHMEWSVGPLETHDRVRITMSHCEKELWYSTKFAWTDIHFIGWLQ